METPVNFKLILMLSAFGFAMGIATVFVIPSNIEPIFWLVIFVVCAFIIARAGVPKPFLHGLCTSLVNSVWITSLHELWFDSYIASHADEAAQMANVPVPQRVMMAIVGPVIGLLSGLVLGLFAFIASKIVKRPAAKAA
jgi:hypothetical protein